MTVRWLDGFSNLLAGLGAASPKTAASGYVIGCDHAQVEAAYRTSSWYGKIVDIPADDATREGRIWQAEPEQITALEAEEARLGLWGKLRQALIWQRLFGGGALYMGGLPGDPSTPLILDQVRKGSLQYLIALHRYEVSIEGRISDPLDPYYGQPLMYRVGAARLHPSRVVRLNGQRGPILTGDSSQWGDSTWTYLQDSVTAADAASSVLAALMLEAKVDVVRMPELMALLGTEERTQLLVRRFNAAAALKSVTNMLVLDKDDEYEQKQINFAALADIVRVKLSIMSGVADIPEVRLLGRSAAGLSATGEGDLRNYYDAVRSRQSTDLQPALATLDEVLIRSTLGARPPEIWYRWTPLWQESQTERSEVNKRDAEADRMYADSGLIPISALATAVQNRLIERGYYPGLEQALADVPAEDLSADPGLIGDAAPLPLYVSRPVANARAILDWYAGQGLTDLYEPADLHVTIAWSREPVDWIKVGEPYEEVLTLVAGGPRIMERFGDHTVLSFASRSLRWRHSDIINAGGSHDWEEYQPHISISDAASQPPPESILPWTGEIVLGPERFERAKLT